MRVRNAYRKRIHVTILTGITIALGGGVWLMPVHQPSPPPRTQPVTVSAQTAKPAEPQHISYAPAEPQRLRIDSLHIDAPVQGIGLTRSGEMESPADQNGIGWYKMGFLPGSLGSAVFAAHFWHVSGRGIFHDIDLLQPNDVIQVITKNGRQYFSVTQKKRYSPQDSTEEVFGKSTKARLNLITCTGEWNESTKSYAERLVVFSEFLREENL